jgi:hypothetical protein
LRTPSRIAVAAPVMAAPPPPMMPTIANWLPPVNIASDSTQVWTAVRPAAVEMAPKDNPYAPVAIPTPNASRKTATRVVLQSGSEASTSEAGGSGSGGSASVT